MQNGPMNWGNYSSPRQKRKKWPIYVTSILISAFIQLALFYGINHALTSGIDVEPEKVVKINQRTIQFNPAFTGSPDYISVSGDKTRIAVAKDDWLRIYDSKSGKLISEITLSDEAVGALTWLPDRNRLIYTLLSKHLKKQVIKVPVSHHAVKDETYSTDKYREETQIKEGFQVSLYSLDDQPDSEPERIQTLNQSGKMPSKVNLAMSTYTNLIYVSWAEETGSQLVQVDIMKRIKDIRLPRGKLSKLVISDRTGTLWAETMEDGTASIYKYEGKRWKFQQDLDGYRLLGVTPNDQVAVATDQNGSTNEVLLAAENGNLKTEWSFSKPLLIENLSLLNDGRLLYKGKDEVVIHSQEVGHGTIYKMQNVIAISPDGKMAVSWVSDKDQLMAMEEVEQ